MTAETITVEIIIDDDTDLKYVKTLMDLIENDVANALPGWLWDGSGLPAIHDLCDRVVLEYEREQAKRREE